jgi:sugar phosphate isomerase/epimerase
MDRRDFLKKSALGIAGAIVGGSVIGTLAGSATGCAPAAPKKRIGLQLYSLRDAMQGDPKATLAAVAAMGYTELENASYGGGKVYGMTPAEFRAEVERLGMKVSSCHIAGGRQMDDAWWAQAIADHKAMGCKYIVIPSFNLGETVEELDATCAYFNHAAEMCKAEGIVMGYHNHSFEFKTAGEGGPVIYDYLIENTSADVVWEMDVYWVAQGGADPVAYLNKYPGRFPVLHIKDDEIIGASGKMDFAPIFEAAYAQGMTDYYVEVERYGSLPPEVCVQKSFDYLEAATYVK